MALFDDFFSSSRGPGVIGLLLGAFVLAALPMANGHGACAGLIAGMVAVGVIQNPNAEEAPQVVVRGVGQFRERDGYAGVDRGGTALSPAWNRLGPSGVYLV